MRGGMRPSSAQNLCVFCATHYLRPPLLPIASRRRHLNTTRPHRQSAAAAQAQPQQQPQPTTNNGNNEATPPSSLTPAEQRGKEHRRQLRLAYEQEQQRRHIADLERRHAAQEAARQEQERRISEQEKAQAEQERLRQGEAESRQRAALVAEEERLRGEGPSGNGKEATIKRFGPHRPLRNGSWTQEARHRDTVSPRQDAREQNSRPSKRARDESVKLFGSQNGQSQPRVQSERTPDFGAGGDTSQAVKVEESRKLFGSQDGQTQPRVQSERMPDFGSGGDTSRAVNAPSGWGSGAANTKPLEYATESDEHSQQHRRRAEENDFLVRPRAPAEPLRSGSTFGSAFQDVFAGLDDTPSRPHGSRLRDNREQDDPFGRPESRDYSRQDSVFPQSRNQNPFGTSQRARRSPSYTNEASYPDGTTYRATPFNPADEYRDKSFSYGAPSPTTDSWQHLSRRTNNPEPPVRQSPVSSQQQRQTNPFEDDPETIDRNFRDHQQSRRPPPRIRYPETSVHDPQGDPFDRTRQDDPFATRPDRKCARCLQVGHTARECTGKTVAKCFYCNQVGHLGFECPKNPQRQEAQSRKPMPERPQFSMDAQLPYQERSPPQQRESRILREVRSQPSWRSPEDSQLNPWRMNTPGSAAQLEAQKPREIAQSPTDGREGLEEDAEQRRASRSRRGFEDDSNAALETLPERRQRRQGRKSMEREDDEAADEAESLREERAARKAQRKSARKAEKVAAQRDQTTPITLPEFISVSQLAQTLGARYEAFVDRLEDLGYDDVFPGKILNMETSGMIAMEYNFDPSFEYEAAREEEERDLRARPEIEDKSLLPTRPPVVTIMGHVDHGKTTILDYLRKSSVAAGEAGGITQHIGAFSVPMSASGRTITFLDTPGHAAFLAMRQRGANVTDIVILVVAADDSVKPQTLESLRCAREAGVPILVAINKVDKEGADVQRVKQDLSRNGVEIEDFGGDVQTVCVSGKTGEGMQEFEEAIVTLSEILDHRAETDGEVEGWVLETTTKSHGRVATVLVKRGTLRTGQVLVAGKTWARIKTLRNETGKVVAEIGPGMPVEVDGWREQAMAGDEVLQAPSEQKAGAVVEYRTEQDEREKMNVDMEAINETRRLEQEKRAKEKAAERAEKRGGGGLERGTAPEQQPPQPPTTEPTTGQITIPFLIKADVSGSAEAVSAYVPSLTTPLIAPQILSASVGPVHESDLDLASAAKAHIVAFNLPPDAETYAFAEARGVRVLEENVIYRVLEQVRAVLEAALPELVKHSVLGEAEVGVGFEIGVGGRRTLRIAGCKVRNGGVGVRSRVRVLRGGEKVYDGIISSLKNVKKDVAEMRKGSECGMAFEGWEGFEVGDLVQTYEEVREKRRL